MDQDIREALTDIKTSVREGFKDVNARIDQLVTKGEFDATVLRLDAQHATLRRDFDTHEAASAAHVQEVRTADADILSKAQAASAAIREELHKELEGFRNTTRWAIGIAATSAGVLTAVVWAIVQYIQSTS